MTGEVSTTEEPLGERLRRLRVERGLSQRRLAAPGVSAAYISRIEAGERRPSLRALRTLAEKLGVSAEYLETGRRLRPREEREAALADAELMLRLGDDSGEAGKALLALLEEARAAGDVLIARRAEITLGLAAVHAGRYAEAIRRLERPVEEGWASPISRPDVHLALGAAYATTKRHERAVELFERCLEELQQKAPEDRAMQVRFATHLSYALSDMGDFERAREVLAALGDDVEFADPYTRIRLYWSLARLASMEGDSDDALAHLRRAIVLLEATEDTLQQARAHLLASVILLLDAEAEKAGPHLERAERLFALGGSARDLGTLRAQQAKRAAMLGRVDEAFARAREALGFLAEHPVERAGAHHGLALAHALAGETNEAEEQFRQAVDGLTESGEWREAVQACQAWANTLRELGRHDEAFEVLARAAEIGLRPRAHGVGAPRERL